jgi:hypothetical protein
MIRAGTAQRLRPPETDSSKETLMKEVEKKDEKKDEPEVPDVSGGIVDGCFPTPFGPEFPGGDYPRFPVPDNRDPNQQTL